MIANGCNHIGLVLLHDVHQHVNLLVGTGESKLSIKNFRNDPKNLLANVSLVELHQLSKVPYNHWMDSRLLKVFFGSFGAAERKSPLSLSNTPYTSRELPSDPSDRIRP